MNPLFLAGGAGLLALLGFKAFASSGQTSGANVTAGGTTPVFLPTGQAALNQVPQGGLAQANSLIPIEQSNLQSLSAGLLSGGGFLGQSVMLENNQPGFASSDQLAFDTGNVVTTGTQDLQPVPGQDSLTLFGNFFDNFLNQQATQSQQLFQLQQESNQAFAKNQTLQTSSFLAQSFLDQNKKASNAFGVSVTPTAEGGFNLLAINNQNQALGTLAPASPQGQVEQSKADVKKAQNIAKVNKALGVKAPAKPKKK